MNRHDLEAQLAAIHAPSHGWALNCCRWDLHAAEEVLQMSYLKVLEGRAQFDGRSAFKTWLFGVIRRTAIEHRRHERFRLGRLGHWLVREVARPPAPVGPLAEAVISDESARLRAALRNLSPRQRDILHLVFYQDMSIEQAAAVMHVSLGTARTHYERGKATMRRLIQDRSEEFGT